MPYRQFIRMEKLWKTLDGTVNTEQQWNSELAKLASKLYCMTSVSEHAQLDKATKKVPHTPRLFSLGTGLSVREHTYSKE